MTEVPPPAAGYCAACGTRLETRGLYCPSCGAPTSAGPARVSPLNRLHDSVQLSSPWRRLGAHLLDAALVVVTLLLGWAVWSLIVWARGQSPAKQLLGMRVIRVETGRPAGWGRMFLREIPSKLLIGFVAGVTVIGLVGYFWLTWDDRRQELWDKMCDTVVVNDPQNALAA
jgi:uncharacterized RDD family membrane protein YckC